VVDTTDWDHLRYVEHAHDYLLELKRLGFHVGLITNIPESWGVTQDQKLAYLKAEISKTWNEAEAFAWSDFEDILLPPRDLDRKPAPFLYAQALGMHMGCPIAYEGDDATEVHAAVAAGFTSGYVVGKNSPDGFFLPADQIFP
jgi:phosphoglycolate phosphatase-like HAD superfamily hydrolase